MRAPRTRSLLALLAFVLGLAVLPHRVCERDAAAYYDGDRAAVDALGASVVKWTARDLELGAFATGSRRFDAEWLFGTYMMAAMGFGQVALEADEPARRAESVARMETCIEAMLSDGARAFDRDAWGSDALATTRAAAGSPADRGHVAYLGYAGLALGLHRLVAPAPRDGASSRFAEVHDALSAALARRLAASPTGFLETYPGEVYPVDNAAALGALALHARATGAAVEANAGFTKGLAALRARAIDPASGLLVQAVSVTDATPRDAPRGSGTALAAYFLAYADHATSADLYRAVHRELLRTVIGFGAVLEYGQASARGGGSDGSGGDGGAVAARGHGDVDSGPIAFGFGVSATGFTLGASRMHDDREAFAALYATAHLFGSPRDTAETRTFTTGGPLGDAILFAMLTAPHTKALAASRRGA